MAVNPANLQAAFVNGVHNIYGNKILKCMAKHQIITSVAILALSAGIASTGDSFLGKSALFAASWLGSSVLFTILTGLDVMQNPAGRLEVAEEIINNAQNQ